MLNISYQEYPLTFNVGNKTNVLWLGLRFIVHEMVQKWHRVTKHISKTDFFSISGNQNYPTTSFSLINVYECNQYKKCQISKSSKSTVQCSNETQHEFRNLLVPLWNSIDRWKVESASNDWLYYFELTNIHAKHTNVQIFTTQTHPLGSLY